ncbi:hypothetical protein [Candidatus Nitrosocosmicus sp. T]
MESATVTAELHVFSLTPPITMYSFSTVFPQAVQSCDSVGKYIL